jgi:uncharacterized phage protein gp47/JayE
MIQAPKSLAGYESDLLASLTATGITQTSPGGKARAFTDAVASEMATLDSITYSNIAQTLLPYSSGNNLDYIGAIFGVTRLAAYNSSAEIGVDQPEGNFEFYVLSGTFGNINNGNNIVVPAGTIISTSSVSGPTYSLDAAVTLLASDSSTYFSATAVQTGSAGNAAANVFTNTNFSNYSDSNYGSLLVTNNYGLIGGADAESDADYAYRINLKLQADNGAAERDLQLAILGTPGIQNVVFERLSGTFNAYIYAISPVIPPSLLLTVQNIMDGIVSYPLVGTAMAPDLIGISLETTISFAAGTSTADQSTIIANAVTAATTYINNLSVGSAMVINTLANVIASADSRIVDIGQPDQPIEAIFIWRSRSDGTRYSRSLITNYTPATGERVIAEQSIVNPINLVPAS